MAGRVSLKLSGKIARVEDGREGGVVELLWVEDKDKMLQVELNELSSRVVLSVL